MLRCLLIEDDAHNARFIADGLRALGHDAVICANGADGLARAIAQPWDVVILDRMLPDDFDGLDVVRAMRALDRRAPVLILSALATTNDRVRGLREGGDDYLAKPFAMAELAARVEALARRAQTREPPSELQVADLRLNLLARSAQRAGRPLQLQPREFRLLAFLMKNAGQTVTRSMLLEAVWDLRFDPRTNLIDVHISRLRNKVDKGFGAPLIHTVRGAGYLLEARAQR